MSDLTKAQVDARLAELPEEVRKSAEAALAIADIVNGLDPAQAGIALESTIRAIEKTLPKDIPNFREVMIQALGGFVGIGEKGRVGVA